MIGRLREVCIAGAALVVATSLAGASSAALPRIVGNIAPESLQAWRDFRAAQPFQVQLIAISPPSKESKPRTLIVSEPPPKVAWPHLAKSLSMISRGCSVQRWMIMAGGYVQDVVCTLRSDVDPFLADHLATLQRDIFGSTSGTPLVALPVPKRKMIGHSLDLHYSASDLHRWLTTPNQAFRASPLAESIDLSAILDGHAQGVFTSADGALVLWAVDRGALLKNAETDFRRFAIGSDLILGAVANDRVAIVVGRGRVESLAHLPPLRSETVMLLAGSDEKSLAQSYERRDLLAGKGTDGVDRAPILLSPQLVDTEFGNLLNVADQLLKGWSMAGQISYANFNYPRPGKFPFDVPVVYAENPPRDRFLFNWNTDGVAYRQSVRGLEVIAPQRTGALSVIYGDPIDRPRTLENTAYDYFAASGDTSLARVMQYTMLFQIFRQFDIRGPVPATSPRYAAFAARVDDATRSQLKLLMDGLDEKEIALRLQTYWIEQGKTVSEKDLRRMGLSRDEYVAKQARVALHVASELRNAEGETNGRLSTAFAEIASAQRLRRELTAKEKAVLQPHLKVIATSLPKQLADTLLEDGGRALQRLGLMAVAADKAGTWSTLSAVPDDTAWNHTAYIVESKPRGTVAHGTGGHNIDAPVTRFAYSPTQSKGTVSVARDARGDLVVTFNPGDGDRARVIAREVGTRKELPKDQIESEVNVALKTARTDPPASLAAIRPANFISAAHSSEFKFLDSVESAYRTRPLRVDEKQLMTELAATKQQSIVLEYLPDGTIEMKRTGSADVLRVSSITAATDALADGLLVSAGGRTPVAVLIKGVSSTKAEALVAQVQSSLRRYPKETVQHVLAAERDGSLMIERPRLVNERIAHNGIRIERNEVKVKQITEGPYKGFSRVEVPITVQAKTPIVLRLIFFIKDFAATSVDALLIRLNSAIAAIKGPTSMAEIEATVRAQLLGDFKDLNVDAVLMLPSSDPSNKLHNVIIADNRAKAPTVV